MYIFCLQYFKIIGSNIRVNAVNHVFSCLQTLLIKRVCTRLAKFGMRSCGGSLITSIIPMTVFDHVLVVVVVMHSTKMLPRKQ